MFNPSIFVLWVLVASSLVFSLWVNPPGGRLSRQRRAGIIHRQAERFAGWLVREVCYRWFGLYVWLSSTLFRLHKAVDKSLIWLINNTPHIAPDVVRRIGAREWNRRRFPSLEAMRKEKP